MAANPISENAAIQGLQRQMAWFRGIAVIALLGVIALAIGWFASARNSHEDSILRTHGIVVTDAQGHDRILIGAPALATTAATEKYGRTNSIVFLGSTGAYRLALGQSPAPVVDGKAMKRIGDDDDYGVILYDTRGGERGGMGFIGGASRAVIALDRPTQDAIGMMVDDKTGFAGLLVNYAKGADPGFELGTKGSLVSMTLRDPQGIKRASLEVGGSSKPAWQFEGAAKAAATKQR